MAGVAEIVKQGRERRNWSQADLALRSGVSASTIARTEQDRGLPNSNTLRRIASAIGYEPDALVRMAREPGAEHPAAWLSAAGVSIAGQSALAGLAGMTTADQLPRRSATDSTPLLGPPRMTPVPHFGGVSAVRTDLREDGGEGFSVAPDVGIDFTVSVDGQCMEPRYQDGERVGCSIRRWESEGFVWERDYWIRFKNGETTLKRVRPDPRNPAKFICAPLHPKAKPFSRLKADVEKAARVVTVLVS
jgi:transcriptional regulator with XRE-family HTH domain